MVHYHAKELRENRTWIRYLHSCIHVRHGCIRNTCMRLWLMYERVMYTCKLLQLVNEFTNGASCTSLPVRQSLAASNIQEKHLFYTCQDSLSYSCPQKLWLKCFVSVTLNGYVTGSTVHLTTWRHPPTTCKISNKWSYYCAQFALDVVLFYI